jgi:hypothetical protein
MRKTLLALAGVAAIATFVPTISFAQGFAVDTPVGGVRIGEPGYHRYYRDDSPRYRERDVYLRGGDCRTITIQRDDGSMKRIRRCD